MQKQQTRIYVGVQVVRSTVDGQECDERPYCKRCQHYAEQATRKCEKQAVG